MQPALLQAWRAGKEVSWRGEGSVIWDLSWTTEILSSTEAACLTIYII